MRLSYRVFLLVSVLLVGGALVAFVAERRSSEQGPTEGRTSGMRSQAFSGASAHLDSLQVRLQRNPRDAETFGELGAAYMQMARETGDPTFYTRAEDSLNQALALDRANPDVLRGLASVALARHDFEGALALAQQSLDIEPSSAPGYGVIGDALVELGRYDEAIAAYQRMLDLKPDLSSHSRVAYIRELYGDIEGARDAMRLAVESSGPKGEGAAWARLQLGELYFNYGDLEGAVQHYEASLQAFPGYVHALARLANVDAAHGNTAEAIARYREVVERYPVIEYVVELGDLYATHGDQENANEQYELVSVIAGLFSSNGVNSDLELAQYYASHDIRLDDALQQARTEYERRPSIEAADTLAWALYKNGRYDEALAYSNEALSLGSKDAHAMFHAGMIRQQLGDSSGASSYLTRALATNRHFSLVDVDVAEAALQQLELARAP